MLDDFEPRWTTELESKLFIPIVYPMYSATMHNSDIHVGHHGQWAVNLWEFYGLMVLFSIA